MIETPYLKALSGIMSYKDMIEDKLVEIQQFHAWISKLPEHIKVQSFHAGNEELFVENVPECLKNSFENARESLNETT